jgi:hypothetical protein
MVLEGEAIMLNHQNSISSEQAAKPESLVQVVEGKGQFGEQEHTTWHGMI